MDSLITTFHIDWKIIIAQVINFGIVLTVMYLFVLKPLKKLMGEREERISKGLEDSKTNAKLLDATKKEYDEVLSKAKIEAHEIFQKGKAEAEENKAKILAQAQMDVETMVANGKKNLESEKAKMIDEAKKEIVSLVVKATEKLLEDGADSNFDKKVIHKIKKA
jgi:F-type H+-transporting ATPase subunit b